MYKFKLNDPNFLPHVACHIELTLVKGHVFVLTGENGAGKTSLMHSFYNSQESKTSKVLIDQKALDYFYDRSLKELKRVFFEANKNLFDIKKFDDLWEKFGLTLKEDRFLSTLSGGENQALKLCLGLVRDVDLYLLDEPSQFLDSNRKTILKNELNALASRGKSVLVIEHDKEWVSPEWKIGKIEIREDQIQWGATWNI